MISDMYWTPTCHVSLPDNDILSYSLHVQSFPDHVFDTILAFLGFQVGRQTEQLCNICSNPFIGKRYNVMSLKGVCVCVCPAVWGYSILSVTVVSVFALTSVFVVPLMRTRFMRRTLVFFIALSIGTLFSTAILQLLPEVQYPSTHLHPNIPNQPQIRSNLKGGPGIAVSFHHFPLLHNVFILLTSQNSTAKPLLNVVIFSFLTFFLFQLILFSVLHSRCSLELHKLKHLL